MVFRKLIKTKRNLNDYFDGISIEKLTWKTLLESLQSSEDGNYLFKVNNGNTTTRCEKCTKLTMKT